MTKTENNKSIYFTRDKLIWGCCLKPNEKLVLHCLNSFMGKDDKCWPAQQRIADMTSISRKTVINILQGLEAQGVIRTHQRTRASGGKSSKDYFVDWETLEFFQGTRPKGKLPMCKQVTSRCEESTHGQCEESSQLLTTHSFVKDHSLTNQGNIDTFSSRKSDSTDELTGNLSNKGGSKTIDSTSSGTASPGSNPDIYGANENDYHSQNVSVEKPKKKWREGETFYYDTDQNGRIIYPKINELHSEYKPYYNTAIATADRETKAWIIREGFVDSVTLEEDDDGELYVDTLNEEYTPQEALSEIPLAQLFHLGIHPDYGSLSADEYNDYWMNNFLDTLISCVEVPF